MRLAVRGHLYRKAVPVAPANTSTELTAPITEASLHPWGVLTDLWRYRHLIVRLSRREIEARYRGSVLGILWTLLHPLMMLAIYSFVFGVVFGARRLIPLEEEGVFPIALFSGLIVFWLFSEVINRSPSLLLSNRNYVKKVVFPLPILPVAAMLTSLFNAAASSLVMLALYLAIIGVPPWSALLLPLLVLPMIFNALGLAWMLASLGVFLRDMRHVVPVVTTMIMFLSAVFYPIDRLPESLQIFFHMNPVAVVIEQVRFALFLGKVAQPFVWGLHFGLSLLVAWLGYAWFAKTRRGFADVI